MRSSIGLDGAACYLLDMCAALIVLLPAVVLSSLSNRRYDKGTAFLPAEVQSVCFVRSLLLLDPFSPSEESLEVARTRARWQAKQGRAGQCVKSKSKSKKAAGSAVCQPRGISVLYTADHRL